MTIIFKYITPLEVCAYLEKNGWKNRGLSENEKSIKYSKTVGVREIYTYVPNDIFYSDYQKRMEEVLAILGLVESRSHSKIARAIFKYSTELYDLSDTERQELARWAELDSRAASRADVVAVAAMWDQLSDKIKDAHAWACHKIRITMSHASPESVMDPHVDLMSIHYDIFPYISKFDLDTIIRQAARIYWIKHT